MSDSVIKVENLSKSYIISHQRQESYTALRDVMAHGVRNLGRRLLHSLKSSTEQLGTDFSEEFFALQDVSFEIKQGDRVGIIGRNGAGKSTLLKILSRITEPSSGRITLKGRVAALLEVGTGFHPELTGRENIFLNGAILGMSRVDIKRRFDEIVAFAEVEKFLDTPVKRYSSGMYVRLAFAVAAHLEPEILVVDEVLAVGDSAFQKKCLGKMEEVGNEGRTVLFVSHNMRAIRQLCQSAILLDNGKLAIESSVGKVVQEYLRAGGGEDAQVKVKKYLANLPPDPAVEIQDIKILQNNEFIGSNVSNGNPIHVELKYRVKELTKGLLVFIRLCEQDESLVFHSVNGSCSSNLIDFDPGTYVSRLTIPPNLLAPRDYILQVGVAIYKARRCMPEWLRISLNVEQTGCVDAACPEMTPGILQPLLQWDTCLFERL